MPLWAHLRSAAIFVFNPVSSMKTRCDASISGWALLQSQRAFATSSRSCSAAKEVFFLYENDSFPRERRRVEAGTQVPSSSKRLAIASSVISGRSRIQASMTEPNLASLPQPGLGPGLSGARSLTKTFYGALADQKPRACFLRREPLVQKQNRSISYVHA